MLRTSVAALALTFAAGAAHSANLRVLSADCDPSLAATIGQGTPGKICTATTSRNKAGGVSYGAADGAFYPLGLSNGIIFDVDPAFSGGRQSGNGPATPTEVPQRGGPATPATPGMASSAANQRASEVGGGMPARFPGNGMAAGAGQPWASAAVPGEPLAPLSPLMPNNSATGPANDSGPELGDAVPTISPVPLPAAGWLLLAGLGTLGLVRRRARSA